MPEGEQSSTRGKIPLISSRCSLTVTGQVASRPVEAQAEVFYYTACISCTIGSAEAELNAVVKGRAEVIGAKSMVEECFRSCRGRIFTDSSAANGIVHREGCGKVKHLECRQLWIQGMVGSGKMTCLKVPRADNPADAMTHYWNCTDGSNHFKKIGLVVPDCS